MDDPQEGTSKVPLIEEDPIPFVDSPSSAPPNPLRDGIILLITSDGGSEGGTSSEHPMSEYYLLPVAPDALRRLSLQPPEGAAHHERKVSCPDETLARDIDRLTPTSFSSRRSSTASGHSRRSSNCSGERQHHRRPSNCSRRSSNCSSRRSSSASRRSSNCSRRSSEDEHAAHHHHHHRSSSVHQTHVGGRRSSHRPPSPNGGGSFSREDLEREELEMGGIPPRHRRIIIMVIGSVSVFILVMSVVLIAVSLTLSPTIDDLVRKGNEEIYRSMSAGASTPAPSTEGATNHTTPPSG